MSDLNLSISARPPFVWRLTGWLLATLLVLLALHAVNRVAPPEMASDLLRDVLNNFEFDRENTVPAWFSSSLLLVSAIVMVGIGVRARRRAEPLGRRWILLGIIFVLLSIDESASFHELLVPPTNASPGTTHA